MPSDWWWHYSTSDTAGNGIPSDRFYHTRPIDRRRDNVARLRNAGYDEYEIADLLDITPLDALNDISQMHNEAANANRWRYADTYSIDGLRPYGDLYDNIRNGGMRF